MTDVPMTIEQLIAELHERNLIRISADTGIHPNSLIRYRDGKVKPSYDNLIKLSTYLRETAGAER